MQETTKMPKKPQTKTSGPTESPGGSSSSPTLTELTNSDARNDDTTSSGQILDAIHTVKEDFVSRFDGLPGAIRGVQGELKALTCMTEAEEKISINEDDLASLKTQSTNMKAAMDELVLKVDDTSSTNTPGPKWLRSGTPRFP